MRSILLLALFFPLFSKADSTVVFNEIMYHPKVATEASFEWVELYNQMSVDIDLSGWSLANAVDFTFPAGTVLGGGKYLVVAGNPDALKTATGLPLVFGPFAG